MFLRKVRPRGRGGKQVYWELVGSYRTVKGSRQRTIAYLGKLSRRELDGWQKLPSRLDGVSPPLPELFAASEVDDASAVELLDLKDIRLQRLRGLVGWPVLGWLIWRDGPPTDELFPLTVGSVLFAPMVLLLYLALFKSTIARRVITIPLIAVIGGMCYSIYLVHNTLILLGGRLFASFLTGHPFAITMTLAFVVTVPLILIFSAIYFILIERPCMRKDWPQRLMGLFLIEEESPPSSNRPV